MTEPATTAADFAYFTSTVLSRAVLQRFGDISAARAVDALLGSPLQRD